MAAVLLSALAAQFGGSVVGDDVSIDDVASLLSAGGDDLTFYSGDSVPLAMLEKTAACAVVLKSEDATHTTLPKWVVDGEPRLFFSYAAGLLRPTPQRLAGIAKTAYIAPSATIAAGVAIADTVVIGNNVEIGERCLIHVGVVIADNVIVGADTVLYPRVVLYSGVHIGERCLIHAGAVIGADGFGYAGGEADNKIKIPHFASVRIGNDVEIGANSAIDRGMLDDTVIDDGVKIDNLVQIGHNVKIGAHTVICGNAGIAGSAIIGRHCVIGGGVGVVGRVNIGDDCRVGGNSTVTHDIPEKTDILSIWPAMPANKWRRLVASVRRSARSRTK